VCGIATFDVNAASNREHYSSRQQPKEEEEEEEEGVRLQAQEGSDHVPYLH